MVYMKYYLIQSNSQSSFASTLPIKHCLADLGLATEVPWYLLISHTGVAKIFTWSHGSCKSCKELIPFATIGATWVANGTQDITNFEANIMVPTQCLEGCDHAP